MAERSERIERVTLQTIADHVGVSRMTVRQAQVLALMLQGKSNKLICRELNLAEGTVKIHVAACLKALNVANRTNAIPGWGSQPYRLASR